jgi:hypothetical protein
MVIAALFSVSAFASGGKSCEKPRLRKHGSNVTREIERAVTAQQAAFIGVVQIEAAPLPEVIVVLRDEVTRREFTTVTDANGAFTIGIIAVDPVPTSGGMSTTFPRDFINKLPI